MAQSGLPPASSITASIFFAPPPDDPLLDQFTDGKVTDVAGLRVIDSTVQSHLHSAKYAIDQSIRKTHFFFGWQQLVVMRRLCQNSFDALYISKEDWEYFMGSAAIAEFQLRSVTVATPKPESVHPGALDVEPDVFSFQAPYDGTHTYRIKVTNSSVRSVWWTASCDNMHIFPRGGFLVPNQIVFIGFTPLGTKGGEFALVQWTNVPSGKGAMFTQDEFDSAEHASRKKITIDYI